MTHEAIVADLAGLFAVLMVHNIYTIVLFLTSDSEFS